MSTKKKTPVADAATPAAGTVEVITTARVFRIGSTTIQESEVTEGLSNEAVRDLLKDAYPEIANATIATKNEGGLATVTFLPQPGRKG